MRLNLSKILMLLSLVFSGTVASAKASRFGLGVVLGDPTGLTGKYWLSRTRAIDGAMAWDLDDSDSLVFQTTYLLYHPAALKLDHVGLDFYYGVGLKFVWHDHENHHGHHDHDDFMLGPRVPVGLSYIFKKSRIQLFGELSVTLHLVESTDVDLGFGLGARYFF